MSRLSQLAVAKRSVTLLLAAALFIAGISAWGRLSRSCCRTSTSPSSRSSRRCPALLRPTSRARSPSRSSARSRACRDSRSSSRRRPTRWLSSSPSSPSAPTSRRPRRPSRRTSRAPGSGFGQARRLGTEHQRLAGRGRLHRRDGSDDGLEAAANIARTEIVPDILGIEGVASADLTGGLEQQVLITLDPDKLADTGVTVAQIERGAPGQPPDAAGRSAVGERREGAGLDDRRARLRQRHPRPRRRRAPAGGHPGRVGAPTQSGDQGRRPPRLRRQARRRRPSPSRRQSRSGIWGRSRRQASRRPATPGRTASRR